MTDAALRPRVRTPGKHIVLFLTAAAVIVAAAINLIKAAPTDAIRGAGLGFARNVSEPVTLDPFLVDLAPDRSGRISYVKLAAVIEPGDSADSATLKAAQPQISERITFLLRAATPEDFAGAEGMARMKMEILRRVNLVIAPQEARDVIITELVIQ